MSLTFFKCHFKMAHKLNTVGFAHPVLTNILVLDKIFPYFDTHELLNLKLVCGMWLQEIRNIFERLKNQRKTITCYNNATINEGFQEELNKSFKRKHAEILSILKSVPNPQWVFTELSIAYEYLYLDEIQLILRNWGRTIKYFHLHVRGYPKHLPMTNNNSSLSILLKNVLTESCKNLEKLHVNSYPDRFTHSLEFELPLKLTDIEFGSYAMHNPITPFLVSIIKYSPLLKKLDLKCSLTDHFQRALREAPHMTQNLEELKMLTVTETFRLSEFQILTQMNLRKLVVLDLSGIQLDEDKQIHLITFLETINPTLRSLTLTNGGPHNMERGILQIFLQKLENLETLLIKEGMNLNEIAEAYKSNQFMCTNLKKLTLEEITQRDDTPWWIFSEIFPTLEFLHLCLIKRGSMSTKIKLVELTDSISKLFYLEDFEFSNDFEDHVEVFDTLNAFCKIQGLKLLSIFKTQWHKKTPKFTYEDIRTGFRQLIAKYPITPSIILDQRFFEEPIELKDQLLKLVRKKGLEIYFSKSPAFLKFLEYGRKKIPEFIEGKYEDW